jgi:3-oxoacyl-[acyl-carrier-protein] synthase-1
VNIIIEKYQYICVEDKQELSEIYRQMKLGDPKFYKMDGLSKLGFITSEKLQAEEPNRFQPIYDRGVLCFNSSSSLANDAEYYQGIQDKENYFPSPSLFVYTLPNIVTGEIAIRNKYYGESSFYICRSFDAEMIYQMTMAAFQDEEMNSFITGWVEYSSQSKVAMLMLVSRGRENEDATTAFDVEHIEDIWRENRKNEQK